MKILRLLKPILPADGDKIALTTERENIINIKRTRYTHCIFSYGLVPVLLLLQQHEKEENYCEAAVILSAIVEINSTEAFKEKKLATTFDQSLVDDYREQMGMLGLSGDTAMANWNNYIEFIKSDVTFYSQKTGHVAVIDHLKSK